MPSGATADYLATTATVAPTNTVSGSPNYYTATVAVGERASGVPKVYTATAASTGTGVSGSPATYLATPAGNRVSGSPAVYRATAATTGQLREAYMMVQGVLRPVVEYVFKAQTTTMPAVAPAGWTRAWSQPFSQTASIGGVTAAGYSADIIGYPDGYPDTQTGKTPARRGLYVPSQVLSVPQPGVLDFFIRTAQYQGQTTRLLAAPTPGPHMLYGRFTVRAKSDALPGYKWAFMLWPVARDNGDGQGVVEHWEDGETDFPEVDLNAGGKVVINQHEVGPVPDNKPYAFVTDTTFEQEHEYTIEWWPGCTRYSIDGRIVLVATRDVATVQRRWVWQVETNIGGADPDPAVSGHVQIMWATIDSLNPGFDPTITVAVPFTSSGNASSLRGSNTIGSGSLVQTSPTTQWSTALADVNTYFTDGTITGTVRRVTSNAYAYLGFRWDIPTDNGMAVRLNGTTLEVGRWNNATFTSRASVPFTSAVGTDYSVKVKAEAGGFYVKAWQAGNTEPASWAISPDFGTNYAVDYGRVYGTVVYLTQTNVAGTAASGQWGSTSIRNGPTA